VIKTDLFEIFMHSPLLTHLLNSEPQKLKLKIHFPYCTS